MVARSIDLSGVYTIDSLTATDMLFVAPEIVNANWYYANLDGAGTTGYNQNVTLILDDSTGLNLSGSGYVVAAVTPSTLTLVSPEAINVNWSSLAALYSGGLSGLSSPAISRASADGNWAGPFTVGLDDTALLVANFVAATGLYKDDGKKQKAFPITVEIEVTPINASDAPSGAAVTFTKVIPGNSSGRDARAATLVANLPFTGRCKVRARRVTPTDLKFKGTVVDEIKLTELFALSPTDMADFGNLTTVHVRNYATTGATSSKERKLNCLVTRKVLQRNVDNTFGPGVVASRNAADIICHMALDPFIAGRQLDEIDVPLIYETTAAVAAYFGVPEAAQFNYTFDEDNLSAEEMIQTVAQAVFCTAYRQGAALRLYFERATTDSILLFNHRNKIPGSEVRTVRFGRLNDYDGVELDYVLPDGTLKTIYIPEDRTATKPKKLKVDGLIDRRGDAAVPMIHAKRAWNKIKYQHTTAEFDALAEASQLIRTQRIEVTDNTRPDVMDGEVRGQQGLVLLISQPFEPVVGVDYTIFLQLSDGSLDTIDIVAGPHRMSCTLLAAPTQALIVRDEAWALTTYQIVGSDQVRPSGMLVTEKGAFSKHQVPLQAINYDSRYYLNDLDFIVLPWSPIEAAGLWGWYDSVDAATITHVAGVVSAWADKGPLGNHVVQATGGAKPNYSLTALAGTLPGIAYSGAQLLELTGIALTAGTLLHVFAVVRPTGTPYYDRVLSFSTTGSADYINGYGPIIRDNASNLWGSYSGGFASEVTLAPDTTAILESIRVDATNHQMLRDGTAAATVAQSFPAGALTRLGIGAEPGFEGGGGFAGVISEVIIIAGAAPSLSDRQKIEGYLAHKWGLVSALPGGHPYISAAP